MGSPRWGQMHFFLLGYKQVVPPGHKNLLAPINIANSFMSRRDYVFVEKKSRRLCPVGVTRLSFHGLLPLFKAWMS